MKKHSSRKLSFEEVENRIVLTGGCQAFGAAVADAAQTGDLGGQVSEAATTNPPGYVAEVTHAWQEDFCG